MNRSRILILLVAAGCGFLALLLLFAPFGESPAEQPVAVAPPSNMQVLIVTKDIAIGERITAESMEWREWPRENVAGFMITREARPDALAEYQDSRARVPMLLGQPLSDGSVVRASQGNLMSSMVGKGLRAFAIRISDRTAGSGFILPNDRVDIISTVRVDIQTDSGEDDRRTLVFSRVIITNARVLSINQALVPQGDSPAFSDLQTAVLELDPRQAELVARSESQGELSLALRSVADSTPGDEEQKPEFATLSEIPNSVSIFRPTGQFVFSCEPNCEPALQLVNAPFPLVVRDVGVAESSPNR